MEKLEITIAESHSADFEEGTWTFQPNEDFVVRAGTYLIINKPDFDKHVQDKAIAYEKWKQFENLETAIEVKPGEFTNSEIRPTTNSSLTL